MIERYEDKEIVAIWGDENKLKLWQEVELAVIQVSEMFGNIPIGSFKEISKTLREKPIDINWWKKKDAEIKHDLNAFIYERRRYLPNHLQCYLHKSITSYDTEEEPFATMIQESIRAVEKYYFKLAEILKKMALKYRFTIMNGRTHGQEAVLQTFGKRCLSWYQDLHTSYVNLKRAREKMKSKLSGVIGNYTGIDPDVEEEVLKILGFKPYYGATQIVPREIYAPVAEALCQLVETIGKIALTVRLGSRSGCPIYQEPFGKKQTGSSAMPHKKNSISTEQIEGMTRMAKGYLVMIMDNIITWEERSIEQSSVERVAWPDLFHVTVRSLKVITRVLAGLVVFPDNMLLEIIESRGCYASSEAKEFLREIGKELSLNEKDEAYRIIQLAAFNAFEPMEKYKDLRENLCYSLAKADQVLSEFEEILEPEAISIRDFIAEGDLRISDQLEVSEEDVRRWNSILKKIFSDNRIRLDWYNLFLPSNLLKNEKKLYKEILGK